MSTITLQTGAINHHAQGTCAVVPGKFFLKKPREGRILNSLGHRRVPGVRVCRSTPMSQYRNLDRKAKEGEVQQSR